MFHYDISCGLSLINGVKHEINLSSFDLRINHFEKERDDMNQVRSEMFLKKATSQF